MAKKVLVLGAGASKDYGFPLGGELRDRIIAMPESLAAEAGIIYYKVKDGQAFKDFRAAFKHSQMYSIDAFLGRRPEFSDIGKKCIASVLLECENQKVLFSEEQGKDHWYQYLFNQLAKRDWDDLALRELAIVTFNYDRSLENFLFVTLQAAYGKTAEEARTKLRELRIVHVYGALCEELPGEPSYIFYDGVVDDSKVAAASRGLIVIPEGRADNESLKQARTLLAGADRVAFLGFGFDPTNVERLSEGGACASAVERDGSMRRRGFYGTRLGIYDLELSKQLRALNGGGHGNHEVGRFYDLGCTDLLRKTQFLE